MNILYSLVGGSIITTFLFSSVGISLTLLSPTINTVIAEVIKTRKAIKVKIEAVYNQVQNKKKVNTSGQGIKGLQQEWATY